MILRIIRYLEYLSARRLWLGAHGDCIDTVSTCTTIDIKRTPQNIRRFKRMINQDRKKAKELLK